VLNHVCALAETALARWEVACEIFGAVVNVLDMALQRSPVVEGLSALGALPVRIALMDMALLFRQISGGRDACTLRKQTLHGRHALVDGDRPKSPWP
jgi:hypothetical protein